MEVNSDTIKKNDFILSQFSSKCISKRIKRELDGLYKLFIDIDVSIENDNLKIVIKEINNKYKFMYGFLITQNYPFSPPKIFFQNKPYYDFLKGNYTESQISFIKEKTGKQCLCCSSYSCHYNWTPAVTINKIINEINIIKVLKRHIINMILTNKIKKKYLVDDIDLLSFLY